MVENLPKRPNWYTVPEQVRVRIERWVENTFFQEYAVEIRVNGHTETATVPSWAVDISRKTVQAFKIGEFGEEILLVLPPGSFGRAMLQVKKERLAELLVA